MENKTKKQAEVVSYQTTSCCASFRANTASCLISEMFLVKWARQRQAGINQPYLSKQTYLLTIIWRESTI